MVTFVCLLFYPARSFKLKNKPMYFHVCRVAGRFARRSIRPTPVRRDLVDVFLLFFKGIRGGNKLTVHVEPKLSYNEKSPICSPWCRNLLIIGPIDFTGRNAIGKINVRASLPQYVCRLGVLSRRVTHYTWFSHQSHVRG